MKIITSEFLVAIAFAIVLQSNGAMLPAQDNDKDTEILERQQMKRDVMAGSSSPMMSLQADVKSLNGPPVVSLNMGNMQALGRYPNYAVNAGIVPVSGPGIMSRLTNVPTGFGASGGYPYEMNFENLSPFVGGNYYYGGAYPGQYPVTGFGLQNNFQGQQQQLQQQIPIQQIPGQLPIQAQYAQQQQFIVPQPQQQGGFQVLPTIFPQFGYNPGFRGYQYTVGNAM